MTASPYLGVILAAGHGSRMGPFGEEVPKPIAPICNKPLLVYQIEQLRALGVSEIIVVIGHLGHLITATLGNGAAYGVRIRYVEQTQRLGLAHAVGQLEPHIDRPFVLMLGDIFFEVADLGRIVREFEEHHPAAVLATKNEPDPAVVRRNFSVHLRDDGTVRRVIEKPRFVETNLKGCGLYLFDLRVFDAIRRTPRTALRDEYELTDSIQILIDLDYSVRAATVVEWDMNLTYIGDLIACCRRRLAAEGRTALVGSGCELADGVELEETVLGDGVAVTRPTRFERCVVLPGVVIDDGGTLADMVITRSARLGA
jgi:NDP-sugar pyrophosphorylase family protein